MTRINLIPVQELSDQHLLAEHREIKRIPNLILLGRYSLDGAPLKYTMGKGHVKFFYDKLTWLIKRYWDLYCECERRKFAVTCYLNTFNDAMDFNPHLENDWSPSEEDIAISRIRIYEKINMRPGWYKIRGRPLNNN